MELFLALFIREMGSPKSRYGLMAKERLPFFLCSFGRRSQNRRI